MNTLVPNKKFNKIEDKEGLIAKILENLRNSPGQLNEWMQDFFELYSDEIYSFPIRFYNFSEDEAGDFYLYAFEHLQNGKRLIGFQGKSKFSTWLFSVLRNLTIDFLRIKKNSVQSTSYVRMNNDGNLVNLIEELPDKNTITLWENDLFEEFNKALDQLKIEQRVLVKLAYIHFFYLTTQEVKWLAENNETNEETILKKIIFLKDIALKKVNQVKPFESKLNASFDMILKLESYLFQFFKENPDIDKKTDEWSEDYHSPDLPTEIIEKIHNLCKRRRKHSKILMKQKKSLLLIRVPYKELSLLLGITEGVLSVQLLRVIQKLEKIMKNL